MLAPNHFIICSTTHIFELLYSCPGPQAPLGGLCAPSLPEASTTDTTWALANKARFFSSFFYSRGCFRVLIPPVADSSGWKPSLTTYGIQRGSMERLTWREEEMGIKDLDGPSTSRRSLWTGFMTLRIRFLTRSRGDAVVNMGRMEGPGWGRGLL